jgi:ribulose-phosphate 3-epimerase
VVIVAPSVLAARMAYVAADVRDVVRGGADWMHLDVMDGQFVPPISFGIGMVEAVRAECALPIDVHLMVVDPDRFVADAVRAGAQRITVHAEACTHLHRTVARIRSLGASPGVAINPATPFASLSAIVADIDLVLVMTVNPGYGGQSWIRSTVRKIRAARTCVDRLYAHDGVQRLVQVDGGIDVHTVGEAVRAGAHVVVAGSAVFGAAHRGQAIAALRTAADEVL